MKTPSQNAKVVERRIPLLQIRLISLIVGVSMLSIAIGLNAIGTRGIYGNVQTIDADYETLYGELYGWPKIFYARALESRLLQPPLPTVFVPEALVVDCAIAAVLVVAALVVSEFSCRMRRRLDDRSKDCLGTCASELLEQRD